MIQAPRGARAVLLTLSSGLRRRQLFEDYRGIAVAL
jgi:hypothetical protein